MTSSQPPHFQALSGALGSAVANAIIYPLDLVATKVQTSTRHRHHGIKGAIYILRHIIRTEGLTGLYRGLPTDTLSTLLSNFLYFYFYSFLHALLSRRRLSSSSAASPTRAVKAALTRPTPPVLLSVPAELAVGWCAGVMSRAVAMPLTVLTVHVQAEDEGEETDDREEHKGAMRVVGEIYKKDGLAGFWAGFSPTLLLALTPALTHLLIQFSHHIPSISLLTGWFGVQPRKSNLRINSTAREFLLGALSNASALLLLYPFLLAKVRLQAGVVSGLREALGLTRYSIKDEDTDPSMKPCDKDARRQRRMGLYDGLAVVLMKGFVSQGVTMVVKHRLERLN